MPRFLLAIAACLLLAPAPAHSQENGDTPAIERDLCSLTTIAEPIHAALADLEALQSELAQAASDDARQEIQNRIDNQRENIRQLRDSFRSTLGGSEAAEYDDTSTETPGIQEQITEILQPILTEIREATSRPRELDSLRNSLDDWDILSDETYGKVISQSPEQVIVLLIGGSLKTYPTAEFLELYPENLSHGFRICQTFGIDYQHQAQSTTSIPETLAKNLTQIFTGEFSRETVRSIKVELSAAGASSLDYTILADFDGSLADKYKTIQRRIQSICVDTCNQNGWIIPFTQITLHNSPQSNA